MKRIKKVAKKGAASFHFEFVVIVHSATFVVADKKWQPESLVVEWKRNARMASTKGQKIALGKTAETTVSFHNEELVMMSNLYKDSDNKFDPKEFKFNLEDVRDKKGKKTLGTAIVDLAKYADVTGKVTREKITLQVQSVKISSGSIDISISSRFVGQGTRETDEMSTLSASSFKPEDAAALDSSEDESDRRSAISQGSSVPRSRSEPDKFGAAAPNPFDDDEPPVSVKQTAGSSAAVKNPFDDDDEAGAEKNPFDDEPADKNPFDAPNPFDESPKPKRAPTTPKASAAAAAASSPNPFDDSPPSAPAVEVSAANALFKKSKPKPESADGQIISNDAAAADLRLRISVLEEKHEIEIENARKERDEALEELEFAQSKAEKMKERYQKEIQSLKEDRDRLEGELAVALEENKKQREESTPTKADAGLQSSSNEELTKESSKRKDKKLNAKLKERESSEIDGAALAFEQQASQRLKRQLEEKTKEVESLQARITEMERRHNEELQRVMRDSSIPEETGEQLIVLRQRVSALEAELDAADESARHREQELLDELKDLKIKHRHELDSLHDKMDALEDELEQRNRSEGKAQKASKKAEDDDEDLRFQLSQVIKRRDQLEQELERERKETRSLQDELEQLQEDLKDAHKSSKKGKDSTSLKLEIEKLNTDMNDLMRELVTAKMALAEAQFEKEQAKLEKRTVSRDLAKEKLRLQEMAKKMTSLEVQVARK